MLFPGLPGEAGLGGAGGGLAPLMALGHCSQETGTSRLALLDAVQTPGFWVFFECVRETLPGLELLVLLFVCFKMGSVYSLETQFPADLKVFMYWTS